MAQFDILISSAEPDLVEECTAALAARGQDRAQVRVAANPHDAFEIARNRRPGLIVLSLNGDLAAFRRTAHEFAAVSPDSVLAAAFASDSTAEGGVDPQLLIDALRSGVRDFLRRPISPAELGQLVDRLVAPPPSRAGEPGKVVAFVSNKGGVGKSTLAVNTAVGLARGRAERVLLVDGSLQMGVCAAMLDVQPAFTIADVAQQRQRLDEVLLRQLATVHESGLHVLAAPADAVEGSDIDDEVVAQILLVARRAYDYVIVDTFPVLDRVVVAVLDAADRAYVVMDNVVPTILGGVRLLRVLDAVGCRSERQRIVLNRFTRRGGGPSAADVAARLDRDVDHVIPFRTELIATANSGRPLLWRGGRFSTCRRRLVALVKEVESLTTPVPRATGEEARHAVG